MNSRRGKNGHRSGMFRLTKRKTFLVCVVLFTFWYFFGLEELKFEDFLYPIEGDISVYVKQIQSNQKPDVDPINLYYFTYDHLPKCQLDDDLKSQQTSLKFKKSLTIIVKSAVKNVETREAIRRTWGAQGILNGVKIRTMFNLGRAENNSRVSSQWEFDR